MAPQHCGLSERYAVFLLFLIPQSCSMTQGRGTLGHMSRIFGGMTGNRHRGVAGRAQQVDKMRDFGSMRVDKLLSTFGLATRSRSKQFLKEIGVSLLSDPEKFLTGATRVNPQEVLIGGEPLLIPRPLHIMLNKPAANLPSPLSRLHMLP